MNYPSRSDDTSAHPDWNQSPHHLSSDLTTKADLNGIVNLREQQSDLSSLGINHEEEEKWVNPVDQAEDQSAAKGVSGVKLDPMTASPDQRPSRKFMNLRSPKTFFFKARDVLVKYCGFIGPGFLIAVAYIDPGNYATDVEAGAATRYKHLFIILMSNLFAIFLQSLCIKLGTVTGLNLAENCRKYLPKWLTITLYIFAESAIIATDIAEVSLEYRIISCSY